MEEAILKEVNEKFEGKAFLSLEEVAQLLGCSEKVVYNWTRRVDPNKRPPRISVGRTIRFPKGPLVQWLVKEQMV